MSRNLDSLTVEAALSRWPFVEQQLVENGFSDIADKPGRPSGLRPVG